MTERAPATARLPTPLRAIPEAQYRGSRPADLVRIVTAGRMRSDSMDVLPVGGV